MATTVWARIELWGYHQWPLAPPERDYLAPLHPHRFGMRADVQLADGADLHARVIEFHDLRDALERGALSLGRTVEHAGVSRWGFGTASCEQIASYLVAYISTAFDIDTSRVTVQVDEDGTAGAIVKG